MDIKGKPVNKVNHSNLLEFKSVLNPLNQRKSAFYSFLSCTNDLFIKNLLVAGN